jgi:hypothetical protein
MKRLFKILWMLTLLTMSALLLLTLGGCTKVPDEQPDGTTPDEPEQPVDPEPDPTPEPEPEKPKEPKYSGYKVPCLVETLYTEQNIVADVVVTDNRF